MKHKCPLCNGSGKIEMVLRPDNSVVSDAAKRMRKEGFSIRHIMKTLGYKNPGSISHLLKEK